MTAARAIGGVVLCACLAAGARGAEIAPGIGGDALNRDTIAPEYELRLQLESEPPVITAIEAGDCAEPASVVQVHGRNLLPAEGRSADLGGNGIHVALRAREWTDTRITVRLPSAGTVEPGARYYIGIHSPGDSRWLSNIDQTLTICAAADEPETVPATEPADTTATVNRSGGQQQPAAPEPKNPFGSSGGRVTRYAPPELVEDAGSGTARNVEPGEVLVWHADLRAARAFGQRVGELGYAVSRRKVLRGLGVVQSALRIPGDTDPARALARLKQSFPDLVADANHLYRPLAGDAATGLVEWSPAAARCAAETGVGVLDTGIDASVPLLAEADAAVETIPPAGTPLAGTGHGTAVAARLAQLLPGARLHVAAVFREGGDSGIDTTAEWLINGLENLVRARVTVINFSLGGPPNRLLGRAIRRMRALDIAVVAATGERDGRALYPATDPRVIGVAAVDRDLRPERGGYRGEAVDFVAPGVDVRVPGIERYLTGASHAAPFVTAGLALARDPAALQRGARDLGDPGRDPVFGHGLVRLDGLCTGWERE